MLKGLSGFQKQIKDASNPGQLDHLPRDFFKILIVDDDEQSRRMLDLILKNSGHVVKFESNGFDAVKNVALEEFDLVLMDVQMPLMDGFEATRRIREWENGRKHLTIIGLTAILESEYKSCLQAGMDDIMSKPFEIDQLYEVIAACVNQKIMSIKEIASITDVQPTDIPILDVQGAVKRFAGDQENYTLLLDEFILSLPGKFEELIRDCESDNWQNLSSHAHNLKGLAANFGAADLSRKVFELDQCIMGGQYDQAKQKLDEVNVSIQDLQTEASAFLSIKINLYK